VPRAKKGLAVLLALLVTGCATQRESVDVPSTYRFHFIDLKKRVGEPPQIGISETDGTLRVTLDHLLCPNDPVSWLSNALWDEYLCSIENVSGDPISVQAIRIVDSRGMPVDRQSHPASAALLTMRLATEYERAGTLVVTSYKGRWHHSLLEVPVSKLPGLPWPWNGIMFFYTPPELYGSEQFVELQKITPEFTARSLGHTSALGLGPGAEATGSMFFPLVSSPRSLEVDYAIQAEGTQPTQTVVMSLDKLAGLHLQTGQSAGQGPKPKK